MIIRLRITKLHGRKSPSSNPEMLIERIEEDNKNVFIVSDEPVLANDFLKMFTDGFGNEEINFIFISTLEDVNLNEIATQHKFSHAYSHRNSKM